MVLSLAFVLAFIGAAVALLIGILIFSEVSDAIICPAGTGGGGFTVGGDITRYNNLGSLGDDADAFYFEGGSLSNFTVTAGKLNEAVLQNGTSDGGTQGEIRLGDGPLSQWDFLHRANVGSNLTSINFWLKGDVDGNPDYPILTNVNVGTETDGFYLYTTLGAGVPPQDTCITIEENNVRLHTGDGTFSCTDNGTTPTTVGIPADDGNWHMVTVLIDKGNDQAGDYTTICVNGTGHCDGIATFNPHNGLGASSVHQLTIGSNHGGSVVENSWEVDDVTIWNGYTLTNTDIDNMWNGGAGASSVGIGSSFVVGYWSFDNATANVVGGTVVAGGGTGQGSEECEGAKDIAWTVIGIIPVALFFALFSIFGAIGVGRNG